MKHTSHPDIAKRLKRAQGHLKSIIDMLEAQGIIAPSYGGKTRKVIR